MQNLFFISYEKITPYFLTLSESDGKCKVTYIRGGE